MILSIFHMKTREATSADISAIAQLFQRSVRWATVREYDEAQREAWAARGVDATRWQNRITSQYFLLAERAEQLLGFGSIDSQGYLDVLYVHPAHQGEGVASQLLNALESWALNQKIKHIRTDASLTARPFFTRKGYQSVAEQTHRINGTALTNYRMEKPCERSS